MPRGVKKTDTFATIDEMLENGQLMRGDDERLVIQRIPIGIPDLDEILNGGIPRHRITILVGNYSSGKSFLAQLLMKNAIEKGLQVAYIDTEQTYDPQWWAQVGLPLDKILVSQPIIGEDAVDTAIAVVKSGIDIVVIDSLAALVPHEETEEDAAKKFIGLQARLIGKLLRLLLSAKHNSAIVCTNQLRESIGGPVPFDVMPGGRAQGFFSSLILRTQRTGWIEDKGERIGFNMQIVCRKSKVGQPFKECTLPFLFRGKIDELSLLLDRGIEADVIKQKGSWYALHFGGLDGESIMGRNSLVTRLNDDPELQEQLRKVLGELR